MEKIITNCQLYRPYHPLSNKLFQVRIEDGIIKAVEQNGYRLEETEADVFDAHGKTLAASFKDTHIHLLRFSLMKKELDLRGVTKWSHLKELLEDTHERKALKNNDWLVGRGLRDNTFSDRTTLLNASDLDTIPVESPIFLLHQDGHECVLNSIALEIVKKEKLLGKEHNQFIEKDSKGKWNGRFKDTAVHFIKMNFRSKTEDEAKEALEQTFDHLAEYGITSVDSDDLNYVGDYEKVWNAYTKLDQEKGLTFGAYLHHYVYSIKDMKAFLKNNKKRSAEGTGNVRVGAFKIFVDGTYRLHTAALNMPYEDKKDTCGELIYNQQELNEMLSLAEENHMQVAMHCIGDRAVETAAKAISQANPKEKNPLRHRIIHMQNTRKDLLKFLGEHKIPVETQHSFLMKEWSRYGKWLGDYREEFVMVGKSFIDHNIIFSNSSDAPIGPLNPLEHIFAAINRTDMSGEPKGGWQAQEKLTIDQAFESYSTTPAYINHSDEYTGKLLPGYQADLILLDRHPHEIGPEEVHLIKVDATWYKGGLVFRRYE
ncbi:MAG: amidohydrolase [Saprospiraceae bacterium]